MSRKDEYNGYLIEPTTRLKPKSRAWTLEVRLTPKGRRTGVRRCRAPNTFATEELAISRCLQFGRMILDGKLQPRGEAAK
jgi:hypothetical protein